MKELNCILLEKGKFSKKCVFWTFLINLGNSITFKLQNAVCICLTSDIWTTKNLIDFLAISVSISNIHFKRETLVMGMIKIPGNHNAEYIKEAIEELVNNFEFDKSKLNATVSDEGSAYVRLFKQLSLSNAAVSNSETNFEDDFEDESYNFENNEMIGNEDGILCFDDQIYNNMVNYDYADQEDFNTEDNCDFNSRLTNVNLEIGAYWAYVCEVPLMHIINISPVK